MLSTPYPYRIYAIYEVDEVDNVMLVFILIQCKANQAYSLIFTAAELLGVVEFRKFTLS